LRSHTQPLNLGVIVNDIEYQYNLDQKHKFKTIEFKWINPNYLHPIYVRCIVTRIGEKKDSCYMILGRVIKYIYSNIFNNIIIVSRGDRINIRGVKVIGDRMKNQKQIVKADQLIREVFDFALKLPLEQGKLSSFFNIIGLSLFTKTVFDSIGFQSGPVSI